MSFSIFLHPSPSFSILKLNSVSAAHPWSSAIQPLGKHDKTDPLGKWNSNFPSIRLAEANTLSLPNTFQAVIVDTPVASGSVHSPYKQAAGARLARGALHVAYGQPQTFPVVESVKSANPSPSSSEKVEEDEEEEEGEGNSEQAAKPLTNALVVTIGGLMNGDTVIVSPTNKFGFEVLGAKGWSTAPIVSSTVTSVTIDCGDNTTPTAIR